MLQHTRCFLELRGSDHLALEHKKGGRKYHTLPHYSERSNFSKEEPHCTPINVRTNVLVNPVVKPSHAHSTMR